MEKSWEKKQRQNERMRKKNEEVNNKPKKWEEKEVE